MTPKFIYHHLGLGDHIICNRIVRYIAKQNQQVMLFVKNHNFDSVKFMYRDLDNINYTCVNSDRQVQNFTGKIKDIDMSKIFIKQSKDQQTMDERFYKKAGIPYKDRWQGFKIDRDTESEKKLFDLLGIQRQYIFIHDDKDRGRNIDMQLVRKDLQVIRPVKGITKNVFDYSSVMQNAKQFHGIDSSFRILTQHLDMKGNMFYHSYSKIKIDRGSRGWGIPRTKKEWKIL